MREIKFRGKSFDKGWIYGNLIQSKQSAWIRESDYYSFKVDKNTIGQYTGLKDKNGKEIYEGDIVRFPAKSGYDKVNYISYECWFDDRDTFRYGWHFGRPKFHGCLCGGDSGIPMEWARQLEVIGNIYENSDLLKD